MRVLCVTNIFPLPKDSGGAVRVHGLLQTLAAAHQIHVLVLTRAGTPSDLVEELAADLRAPVETFERVEPLRDAGRGATILPRWARALLNGTPPWVLAQFSSALRSRLESLAADFDVLVLLDDYAGVYARRRRGLPIVADKSNVLGWSIANAPGKREGWVGHLRDRMAVHLTRRFERRYLGQVDAVVTTSDKESMRLDCLYGRRADAIVPTAVDLPAPHHDVPRSRAVGWIGLLEYEPNVAGLIRFVETAWAPLGEEGLQLFVAGRNPPAAVRALERLPGVTVLGYVADLDDFLAGLAAGVVPLWSGAGVKVKTLTLLAAGLGIAATPVGLEGIAAEHGRHCFVADDPRSLAAHVRDLVADDSLARRLGSEGRRLVEERYTWASAGPAFMRLVEATVARTRTRPDTLPSRSSLPVAAGRRATRDAGPVE